MIHIIKNYKWVITTSLICIIFCLLTFFTFINQSFISLNDENLKKIIFIDILLLSLFFILILRDTYKIFKRRREKKLGSETSLRYMLFFSATTLLPSILIAIFSLFLFNVVLQKYFDNKIKSAVNNSAEVAKNYVEQTRNSIESDILLIVLDLNSKASLFYENPNLFLNLLTSQRLLRRLDEIHLLDGSGNIIMSNIIDPTIEFVLPSEEDFLRTLNGKPVRIIGSQTDRTSSLVKLSNFIDTYLYVVKFMDPKLINYLKETSEAVSFYYSVEDSKLSIKITFAIIYLLIVSLLLFFSIVLSTAFASKLTTPIINLITASEKISTGDLSAKVPKNESNKEFDKLNENFNSMINKLKKQQDKLILSERHAAWENVARKLAHEIKNPLTPIQLSIDMLKEKYVKIIDKSDKNFFKYLDIITKQINGIENLVNEFSDFARMPKPILKNLELNQLILNSISLFELSYKDIKFTFSKKENLVYVNGDRDQLNRVFTNLIKNSIESLSEKKNNNVDFKGKINIDIEDYSDYIYITIEDNGLGFSETDIEKMQTPYFTTKKKGTGLGLAIVTKIINDHNSAIIFSNTNNYGAKVEIKLSKI